MSCSPYYAGNGLEDHKYWDRSDEMYMVDGHLNWYIEKVCSNLRFSTGSFNCADSAVQNMVLGNTVFVSLPFYRTVPVPAIRGMAPYMTFHDELVLCDLDNAPDYQWKNVEGMLHRITFARIVYIPGDEVADTVHAQPSEDSSRCARICQVSRPKSSRCGRIAWASGTTVSSTN